MTKDEFKRQTRTFAKQANAARLCGDSIRSIEISVEIAKLTLAHPEFWPDDYDPPDWLKIQCERTIREGEAALDINRRVTAMRAL